MYGAFIDLDELIILCKDRVARKFIQEAAACYRAGAYRSCIISTWNAVVFDFIDKLKNLADSGNGEAKRLLESFDEMSRNSKVKELWQFESKIPDIALSQFEFIAPVEKEDIERLFKDRSRCAHPSMASIDDPFEATAELARYHLRSAVMHLLQRPATQGKSALEKIWNEIGSSNFPKDPDKAAIVLSKGALGRARKSLIKEVICGLTIDLLAGNRLQNERDRQFSALTAVFNMYKSEVTEIFRVSFPKIILEKVVEDQDWDNFIEYIYRINVSDFIDDRCIILSKEYISNLDSSRIISSNEIKLLEMASNIDFLQELVNHKIDAIPTTEIISLTKSHGISKNTKNYSTELLRKTIQSILNKMIACESLEEGNLTLSFQELFLLSEFFSRQEKIMLLDLYYSNEYVREYSVSSDLIRRILGHDLDKSEYLDNYWIDFKEKIKFFSDNRSQDLFKLVDDKSNNEF